MHLRKSPGGGSNVSGASAQATTTRYERSPHLIQQGHRKGQDTMKGRTASKASEWHVRRHYDGKWAVYDTNSRFRRTFETQSEAQAWAEQQQREKGKR